MAFFGLKLGLDLEMRAAHPHQKFQGVPPPHTSGYLKFRHPVSYLLIWEEPGSCVDSLEGIIFFSVLESLEVTEVL